MENLKCDLCKKQTNDIINFTCNHNSCNDCFYKICLFNNNTIKSYNIDTEKILHLYCIVCYNGVIQIVKQKIVQILKENVSKKEKKFDICSLHVKDMDSYCSNCKIFMCVDCFSSHKILPIFSSHQLEDNTNLKTYSKHSNCSLHENMTFLYFCLDCKLPLCEVCRSIEHEGHKRKYIKDFQIDKKNEIKSHLNLPSNSLEETLEKIDESDKEFREDVKKLSDDVRDKIIVSMNFLKDILIKLDNAVEKVDQELNYSNSITKIIYEKLLEDIDYLSNSAEYNANLDYLSKLPKDFMLNKIKIKIDEKLEETLQEMKNLADNSKNADCIFKFRNTKNLMITNTLKNHTNWVKSLLQLKDGKLVSGSSDKTIRIWDSNQSFKCIQTLTDYSGHLNGLLLLQNGRLASASIDYCIRIWNPEDNFKCMHVLEGHRSYIFNIIQLKDGRIASSSDDFTIRVWNDKDNFKCSHVMKQHIKNVRGLCQLKDGQLASASDDKTIKIWSLDEFECIQTLIGHTNSVLNVIQLDDERLASSSCDNTIKIWDPMDNFVCTHTLRGHTAPIYSFIKLKDGRLASGSNDYTIKIWDPKENFNCIYVLNGHSFYVQSLTQLKDGRIVSGSDDYSIKIWDPQDNFRCISTLNGHTDSVRCLIQLDDGKIVSSSDDKTILIWE